MRSRERIAPNLDRVLLVLYLVLVVMGWANIYSAAYDPDHANILDQSREYGKQGLWIGVSLLIGAG
ncbi:MAG: rod shape-determining protein RodA, partial [Flavobacteriales bacterium]|nr:rod shape-determining protein RodA [Flavobacteriales bacterium]MCB0783140.1 rod shape-determining protein RodA [Flavobacteriales bacterium]